jgi:MYXO-CTERM domain-containing protein
VTQLNLMDADTDQPVAGHAPLAAGATIDLASLPSRNLTVVAVTSPSTVGSVRFEFDGNANYRVENAAPYALQGDNAGDLAPAPLGAGQHSVTAVAYSAAGATGTAGAPLTRVFTLIDSAPAPSPGSDPVPTPSPGAPAPAAAGPGPDGIQWLRDLCGAGTAGSPSWAWALAGAILAGAVARRRR